MPFLDHGTRRRWGVSVTPRSLFTPGKDPVLIAQEAGWTPGPVWTGAENLAPTGIRSPDRPARSQSLYRLSYLAHQVYNSSALLLCLVALEGMRSCVCVFGINCDTILEFLGRGWREAGATFIRLIGVGRHSWPDSRQTLAASVRATASLLDVWLLSH